MIVHSFFLPLLNILYGYRFINAANIQIIFMPGKNWKKIFARNEEIDSLKHKKNTPLG